MCNILETINLNLVAVLINIIGNINLNFYDLNKRKLKKILFSLEVAFVDTLEMISHNLLIIGEVEYLTIINVENYQNIKNIKLNNNNNILIKFKFYIEKIKKIMKTFFISLSPLRKFLLYNK